MQPLLDAVARSEDNPAMKNTGLKSIWRIASNEHASVPLCANLQFFPLDTNG
jgi:hypothetical protein